MSFVPGKRAASGVSVDPNFTLGAPDYTMTSAAGYLSLGCDGVLTLRFVDNALVDVDGPDLYIFEVGPAVEPTILAISTGQSHVVRRGSRGGSTESRRYSSFHHERADLSVRSFDKCRTRVWWHHAGRGHRRGRSGRLSESSHARRCRTIRYGPCGSEGRGGKCSERADGDYSLKGTQRQDHIEGHTDDVGSDQDNQRLSEARARTVGTYLRKRLPLSEAAVTIVGFGESRPTEPNDSEDGRAKNRRVDILVIPDS